MKNILIFLFLILNIHLAYEANKYYKKTKELEKQNIELTDKTDDELENNCPEMDDYQIKCDSNGYILNHHGKFVDRFSWKGCRELDSLILKDNL